VSNDFGDIFKEGVKIAPKRIRSKHRLRLINRLTEREETVSELAKLVGLRVPHASAEIRRMREEGLVSSDLVTGSRGAKIRLTEEGWKTLHSDEWSKALQSLPIPRDTSKYCILYREGLDILFAFLSQPKDPLVLIPERLPESRGNEGVSWNWAALNETSLRWFNLDNMEMSIEEPEAPSPESIESYLEKPRIVGVIRGRILNKENIVSVSPGKWFNQTETKPKPPLIENSYHRGTWTLGECHDLAPNIRPKNPIFGVLKDSLHKSMLLRTSRKNALLIGDLRGLESESSTYPLQALDYWIEMIHPRITANEKKKRLTALKEKVSTNRRIRTSDSTWRRFRKDWGNSIFDKNKHTQKIETRGLKRPAIESLIKWAITEEEKPLVVDIGNDISDETLSMIHGYPHLRLIIGERIMSHFENYDILEIDPLRPLPWLNFSTKEGIKIPLKLIEQEYQDIISSASIERRVSPWEIMNLKLENSFSSEELDEEYYSIVKSSISQYPMGDEAWANQMEARYPLASWIASPPQGRWPRWQRLRSRLDSEWLALLDLDFLPIERLVEVADEAPYSVLNLFSRKMTTKLREDSDIFLRSRPAMDSKQASTGVSWIAAQFLSNAAWMPESMHADMLEWAIDAWMRHPPLNSLSAIKGINWLYSKNIKDAYEVDRMMIRIKDKHRVTSPDNHVKIWSDMLNMILNGKKLEKNELERVLKEMPANWWAVISHKILLNALKEEEMKWLLKIELPWCATILRPMGDKIVAPGLSSKEHPGCDFRIFNAIKNVLNTIESESILDLYDSLESSIDNVIPSSGRKHELVGWLAQPVEKWPNFAIEDMMKGDKEITERLILNLSGYDINNNKSH